jgi:hypothetical protein
MDREITRVYCEWLGVHINKYPWFDMLSLLVREIGFTARTFGSPYIYRPDDIVSVLGTHPKSLHLNFLIPGT